MSKMGMFKLLGATLKDPSQPHLSQNALSAYAVKSAIFDAIENGRLLCFYKPLSLFHTCNWYCRLQNLCSLVLYFSQFIVLKVLVLLVSFCFSRCFLCMLGLIAYRIYSFACNLFGLVGIVVSFCVGFPVCQQKQRCGWLGPFKIMYSWELFLAHVIIFLCMLMDYTYNQ